MNYLLLMCSYNKQIANHYVRSSLLYTLHGVNSFICGAFFIMMTILSGLFWNNLLKPKMHCIRYQCCLLHICCFVNINYDYGYHCDKSNCTCNVSPITYNTNTTNIPFDFGKFLRKGNGKYRQFKIEFWETNDKLWKNIF